MSQTFGRYQVDLPGPPEAMRWTTEPVRPVGAGEVRVRHEAIGVDFIDTQIRSGQISAALPTGLGFAAVGIGAAIVYDGVGQSTFAGSLDSARRFGLVVSYGWPSGDPDLSLMTLRAKGSLFITRPTVTHYTAETDDLREGVATLFGLVREGQLRIKVDHTYPLREAAQAHHDLVAGRTAGSVVLIP